MRLRAVGWWGMASPCPQDHRSCMVLRWTKCPPKYPRLHFPITRTRMLQLSNFCWTSTLKFSFIFLSQLKRLRNIRAYSRILIFFRLLRKGVILGIIFGAKGFIPRWNFTCINNQFEASTVAQPFKLIWESKCVMKLKVFAWLLFTDRLNTKDMLRRTHYNVVNNDFDCVLRSVRIVETLKHLFFTCSFSTSCWQILGIQWQQNLVFWIWLCMLNMFSVGLSSWKFSS